MIFKRKRLSPSAREALYDKVLCEQIAARLTNDLPLCNLCNMKILRGIRWHESHLPLPHAITGMAANGIAHPRCNTDRWAKVEAPMVAKVKRQRRKDIGATLSARPLPCGRDDSRKKKLSGEVVNRRTENLVSLAGSLA